MTSPLDMSLDDLIKSNKKPGPNRTRPPRGSGPGPSRRFPNRAGNRTAPYSKPVQAPDAAWQHDMFVDDGAGFSAAPGRASSLETGTKIYISNLDFGVSTEDIKELFQEVGDVKRYAIHYDRSGRSKGTAEVVFSRRSDAAAAFKRYNGVQLDGKPMKIEIVGTNIATPGAGPHATNGKFANQNGAPRSGQGRGGFSGRSRGRGRGGRRGRGRGRAQGEKVSAEDLDADLENYHKEAMQTE
ncbi:hypothetical protein CCACVL1_21260 [Corchorus capsularis]|uniref:RRM domain-containing protein n=1 Tax=Corchorus capsularis TaxID=210143 RepID=A0A1R3H7M9_COCAP|nr:hypothetical protein CCACVL1_21260 [Corchorus capsularis]